MRLLEFMINIMEVIGTCKDFAIFGGWRWSSDERCRCGENGRGVAGRPTSFFYASAPLVGRRVVGRFRRLGMVIRQEVPMRRKWSWGCRTSKVVFFRIGTSCRTSGWDGRKNGKVLRGADREDMFFIKNS